MNEQEKKQAQKSVLETILNKGTKFDITYKVKERRRGFLGFLRPKVTVEKKESFTIKQPTLGVLDRMSEIWLGFDIKDMEGMSDGEAMSEGYKMVQSHAMDMARILAIAVVGEDPESDKEVERLTELFYKSVKPSQLPQIAMALHAANHISDFIVSMRLMKMSMTTTPTTRIE